MLLTFTNSGHVQATPNQNAKHDIRLAKKKIERNSRENLAQYQEHNFQSLRCATVMSLTNKLWWINAVLKIIFDITQKDCPIEATFGEMTHTQTQLCDSV